MKKLIPFLCLSLMLCWSCSDDIQIDIDNPLNEESNIVIDDQFITLPPKTTIKLEVARGDHKVRLQNDSTFQYNFEKDRYLINPTRTDYLIEKIYYSVSGNPVLEATFNKANRKTVVFLGYEFEGNYEVFNDLIKVRDWHYKQRQNVPDVIKLENKKFNSSKTIRKLYAADEFLQLLSESQEQD